MFVCQLTGKNVPPGVAPVKLVTKIRKRTYARRDHANRVATWKPEKADKIYSTIDPGGEGWEIAEELYCSPQAAKDWLDKLKKGEVQVEEVTPKADPPYQKPPGRRGERNKRHIGRSNDWRGDRHED